jgi:hypothetical protein
MNKFRSSYRVPTGYLWLAVIVGVLALLAACGGGSGGGGISAGVGSGGTGATFSGPISGFGSIIVNGVRIDDSAAQIMLDDDDNSGRNSDLRLGMMVEVEGEKDANGTTGKATRISARSFVQGPISAINASANQFTVLGIAVTVTPGTVYDGAGITGLGSLAVNDTVEIHGIADAAGGVKATRVERKTGTNEIRLIGTIQSVTANDFGVNGITVRYQTANLANAQNGLATGMLVRVKGTSSNPTTVIATKVQPVRLTPAARENQHVELEGLVTKFTSATTFEVNGQPVTVASGASVKGVVALGSRIEVEGRMTANVLVASEIKVEDEKQENEEAHELHGLITDLNLTDKTFKMRNGTMTVKWDANTRFDSALPQGSAALRTA